MLCKNLGDQKTMTQKWADAEDGVQQCEFSQNCPAQPVVSKTQIV